MSHGKENQPVISSNSVLHCDLDSFFASVEQSLRPELAGYPVAVSAARGQSVITAVTYDAKKYGVRAGMPLFKALKVVPNLKFINSRMAAYHKAGEKVRSIVLATGSKIETLGIDEFYLDLSSIDISKPPISLEFTSSYDKALLLATWIRNEVYSLTGLAITIGVGSNKIIAKLASDHAKPNGLLIIPLTDEQSFIESKPLSAITGIGLRTQQKLDSLGLKYVADVKPYSQLSLRSFLGKRQGDFLYAIARNKCVEPIVPNPAAKSTSVMRTFPGDGVNAKSILLELHAELIDRIAATGRALRFISIFATNGITTISDRIDLRSASANYSEHSLIIRRMIFKIPDDFMTNFCGISFEGLSNSEQLTLDFPLFPDHLDDFSEPPEFIEQSPSEILRESIFRGMLLYHPKFGPGTVLYQEGDGFVVTFPDRIRSLSFDAPVSIIDDKI
jgi:DNA polymerase-4